MNSGLPIRENLPIEFEALPGLPRMPKYAKWSEPWTGWLQALVRCVAGWNTSMSATKVHDFGLIAAHTEASTTVTVAGASTSGTPTVIVTPSANTAGIALKGVVTAKDTVTIYALNTTAAGIDPASATYRVTVLQP